MAATKSPLVRLGHIRDEIDRISAEIRIVDRGTFTQNIARMIDDLQR
jgi:hypothetical protein